MFSVALTLYTKLKWLPKAGADSCFHCGHFCGAPWRNKSLWRLRTKEQEETGGKQMKEKEEVLNEGKKWKEDFDELRRSGEEDGKRDEGKKRTSRGKRTKEGMRARKVTQ